jgi:Flp pilus assembly protein CpaB
MLHTVTAKPRRRARTTRISTGHVAMVLAGLLGVVLTLSVLRAADDRRAVLVAATDLAPGTVLDESVVRTARIDAGDGVLASLFAPDDMERLRGDVVTGSVAAGALITADDVRAVSAGAATRAMSVPLPRARAVGGKLRSGDRVDILAVERDGVHAGYVMTDVEVLDVDGDTGGPLGGPDEVTITLAVDPDGATRVAAAVETGTVTLVRATGAAPLDTEPFVPGANDAEAGEG